MTRIAARATRGRGKKLPRGQACASNPETRKHRSKIIDALGLSSSSNGMTVQEKFTNSIKPKLTREMLEKFDAIQQQKKRQNQLINDGKSNENNIESWLQSNEKSSSDDITTTTAASNSTKSDNIESINDEKMNKPTADRIADDAFTIGNISAASIWSNCTNISFDKFLNDFDPRSKLHKTMLTVLATVRDAIEKQNGSENETEYFTGLLLTMDCCESEEQLTAAITLLQMVIKRVPTNILRLKFAETTQILMKVLSSQPNLNQSNSNGFLLKSIINSFHTLLLNQELIVWQQKSTQQIFDTILMFVTNIKPRVRKAACFAIISLVCSNENAGSKIAAKLTAEYCISQLDQHLSTANDENLNIILYIFTLLSDTMSSFPSVQYTKHVCESLLSHMTLGNVLLVSNGLHTLYSFFLRRPSPSVMTSELNARLLNALYDYQPNINDEQPLNAWIATIKESLLCLYDLDRRLFGIHCIKLVQTFIQILQSDSRLVHANIVNSLQAIMKIIIDNHLGDDDDYRIVLEKLFAEIENGLKYQYSHAWPEFIPLFGEILIITTSNHETIAAKIGSILQRLAIIYESNDNTAINNSIESVFKKLLSQTYGARFILKYCPIIWTTGANNVNNMANFNELNGQFSNAWLIALLRERSGDAHTELSLFYDHFLPIADELMQKLTVCQKIKSKAQESVKNRMMIDSDSVDSVSNNSIETCLLLHKELNRCLHAIWSLLPSFCRNPIDAAEIFPKIAKRIGENLYNEELSIYSLAALKNLFTSSENNREIRSVIGSFAKNFLPILFNVYTNENEQTRIDENYRYPILIVIKHMIVSMIVNQSNDNRQLYRNFFQKLLTLLNESIVDGTDKLHLNFRQSSLTDLLNQFLQVPKHIESNEIDHIYNRIILRLISSESKKGYKLMESILTDPNDDGHNLVLDEFIRKNIRSIIDLLIEKLEKHNSNRQKSPTIRLFNIIISRIVSESTDNSAMSDDSIKIFEMSTENTCEFIENILPSILKQLLMEKSSKIRKQVQKFLSIISDYYESINNGDNEKIISLIIDPLIRSGEQSSIDEVTMRLDAITYLFVEKYHYPLINNDQLVAKIADTIFSLCFQCENDQFKTRKLLDICFEFIRHFMYKSSESLFNCYIEVIVNGITNLPHEHRTKYFQIIKVLLTKLSRRFGHQLIDSIVSDDYKKVMKNIRKLESRKKKQRTQSMSDNGKDDDQSDRRSRLSRKSRRNFNDDDNEDVERLINDEFNTVDMDDDDDGRSTRKSVPGHTNQHLDIMSRLSNVSLKSYIRETAANDDPIDLLSSNAKQNILSKLPRKVNNANQNDDDDENIASAVKNLPCDKDGRINLNKLFDRIEEIDKRGRKRTASESNIDADGDSDDDDDSNDDGLTVNSYKPGGRGIHRPLKSTTASTTKDNRSVRSKSTKKSSKSLKSSINTGDAYRSKKARGDVKRRGMPDPYAYYPFAAMSLNRRKQIKQRSELKAIVRGAQKGASKGHRIKNKRRKT